MKILFLSLSRSGHHAVINWLLHQFAGTSIFYNHCELGWADYEMYSKHGRVLTYKEGKLVHDQRNVRSSLDGDNQVYSIESFDMDDYSAFDLDNMGFDKVCIILRDFRNWAASSIRGNANNFRQTWTDDRGRTRLPTSTLWEKQAKEFIGETSTIMTDKVMLSYDHWFTSEEYRRDICQQFGVVYSDNGLQDIPRFGSGSSFTQNQYDGRAQSMDTLTRYKSVDAKELGKLITPEIDRLNREIFL